MHQRVQCLLVCVNVFPAPKAMASSRHPTGATTSLSTSQSKRVCAVRMCVFVDRLMFETLWGVCVSCRGFGCIGVCSCVAVKIWKG